MGTFPEGAATETFGDTLLTVIKKDVDAWSEGVPLSVTSTVMSAVAGPSAGVQVNTPVVGSMLAPAGTGVRPGPVPATREKVRALAGRSVSKAVAVKLRRSPSSTDLLPMGFRTGATLTSLTVTVSCSSAKSDGLP